MAISKTIVTGAAVAVLGFLQSFNIVDFAQYIPDQYEPLIVSGVGFLMIILRMLTTTPVVVKAEK